MTLSGVCSEKVPQPAVELELEAESNGMWEELEMVAKVPERGCQFILRLVCKWWVCF